MRSVLAVLAAVPLIVGTAGAGELEPPGPPAPTMKSLNELPPTWSQLLDSTDGEQDGCNSSRFRCVMDAQAVLDLETGLVWERMPDPQLRQWVTASDECFRLMKGGRKGWRLPTISELMSLVDPAAANPALPPDHPFLVTAARHWSSTTDYVDTTFALVVDMADGTLEFLEKLGVTAARSWCVRGSGQTDYTSFPNTSK